MKALVLSGGGSKGSYQIGVWKALKKLNIKYDIVTGTSVGALNGALITQKSYYKAISVWKKLNLKVLFGDEAIESTDDLKVMKMYSNNFFKHGGMEVKQLEELISNSIDYKKFYNSNIDYGLVTFDLSNKKPLQITKKEIPKSLLADYLMASASCYPAFKKKEIEGKKYIDGGIVDNLPINLAINMGADEIIAVDLNAPGIKQKPIKKVPTLTIKPNNKLTNFLNFNEEGARKNMKFGYNDTMKILNQLEGKTYTFKKGDISKNRQLHKETYEFLFNKIMNTTKLTNSFKDILKITTTNKEKVIDNLFLRIIESLGKTFGLDETVIYTYKSFNKELKKKFNKLLLNKNNKKIKKKEEIIINLYKKMMKKEYKELRKLALITPIDFLKALYIYSINEV